MFDVRSLALGCMALFAAASPAAAQLSSSASGSSDAPVEAHESAYWSMMSGMGSCMADQKPDLARAFLATTIDSSEEGAAFKALFDKRYNLCLGNFVKAGMVRAHVRGIAAEGLFEDLDQAALTQPATPPAAPAAIANMHDLARCFVIAHPDKARNLLAQTRLATKGEESFVGGLAADFSACLPDNRAVKLNPTSVRLAVAEALYRVATGAPAPTMASRKR